jgi:hypothetical protein
VRVPMRPRVTTPPTNAAQRHQRVKLRPGHSCAPLTSEAGAGEGTLSDSSADLRRTPAAFDGRRELLSCEFRLLLSPLLFSSWLLLDTCSAPRKEVREGHATVLFRSRRGTTSSGAEEHTPDSHAGTDPLRLSRVRTRSPLAWTRHIPSRTLGRPRVRRRLQTTSAWGPPTRRKTAPKRFDKCSSQGGFVFTEPTMNSVFARAAMAGRANFGAPLAPLCDQTPCGATEPFLAFRSSAHAEHRGSERAGQPHHPL